MNFEIPYKILQIKVQNSSNSAIFIYILTFIIYTLFYLNYFKTLFVNK